jgi:hypothetical protein
MDILIPPKSLYVGGEKMEKKECKDMNSPAIDVQKSSIQKLIKSGKVELFKVDHEGNVLLDPNNPEHQEWLED